MVKAYIDTETESCVEITDPPGNHDWGEPNDLKRSGRWKYAYPSVLVISKCKSCKAVAVMELAYGDAKWFTAVNGDPHPVSKSCEEYRMIQALE